ncbi:MAG: hypothetical protein R6X34_07175, partial [Chloroflexota bacterium]
MDQSSQIGPLCPRFMTFVSGKDEFRPFREAGLPGRIKGVMTTQFPDFLDTAPEQVWAYLFDRLPVGTAVIDREFR